MKLYDHIHNLLSEHAELRDSDKKLAWVIWQKQGVVVDGRMSQEGFMRAEHFETIRRTRQKVQEDHEELKSNPLVQAFKDEKQETKGMFVYRHDIDLSQYHKEYLDSRKVKPEVKNNQLSLI